MKDSYNKRQRRLPAIVKEDNNQKERQLLMEMSKIDEILKSDSLQSVNGYIFTDKLKNRLAQDLYNCLNKHHRLISFGFQIWQQASNLQTLSISSSLIKKQPTFKQQLQKISIMNIQKFQQKKNSQLSRLNSRKWQIKVHQNKPHLNEHKNNVSTILSRNQIYSTNSNTPNKQRRQHYAVSNKFITQKSQSPEQQTILQQQQTSIYKIQKMLHKVKANIITIWLPPKSYPQFYGIIVPSVIKTSKSTVKCRIKKYILFKQALNSRLFQSILQFLTEKYQTEIDNIQMIVDREQYRQFFQKMGCKIKSWQGVDKISICYTKKRIFD